MISEEKFRLRVAQLVSDGGWSSVQGLVDIVPIEILEDRYGHIFEPEGEEE